MSSSEWRKATVLSLKVVAVHVLSARGSTVTHLESEVSNFRGKLCQLTGQTRSYFPTRHAAQQHRRLHCQSQPPCSSAKASAISRLGEGGRNLEKVSNFWWGCGTCGDKTAESLNSISQPLFCARSRQLYVCVFLYVGVRALRLV